MKKSPIAANPDAYVASMSGWQRTCVETLRLSVHESATLELRDDTTISKATVLRLTKEAVALNKAPGDPTEVKKATGARNVA